MGGRKSKPSGNKMGEFKLDPIRFEVEVPWGKVFVEKIAKDSWEIHPSMCPLYRWSRDRIWRASGSSFHWSELPAQLVLVKDTPLA